MSTAAPDSLSLPDLSGLLTMGAFTQAAKADKVPDGAAVAKDFNAEIRVKQKGRGAEFTLTSGSVDRDQDVIEMGGWQVDNFKKNPVWLWSHDTRGDGKSVPIIGIVTELDVSAKAIEVAVDYVPAAVNPLAESVYQMHAFRREQKALKDAGGAASVGADPMEWVWDDKRGGVTFKKHDLLEGSDVVLPANPDALARMKAAGVDLGPVGEWAERYRKAAGVIQLDQARAEAVAKALDPTRGLAVFELAPEEIQPPTPAALERFTAGAALLDAATRQKVAPVMIAAGLPLPDGFEPEGEPDPTPQKTVKPDPEPEPVTTREPTEEEIDRLARQAAQNIAIERLGRPLPTET